VNSDRGYLTLNETARVYGDVCDSCGVLQPYGRSGGLKILKEVEGDWLLCAVCHPSFNDPDQEED
jgi:hypothetical protein